MKEIAKARHSDDDVFEMPKLSTFHVNCVFCSSSWKVRRKGGEASSKSKGSKICPKGKAWAQRTFDTYPSAYANMAASKYCKDPNYAKKSKGKA